MRGGGRAVPAESGTEHKESRAPEIADLAMLLTATIWAANNVIVKAALDLVAPLPYVFSRFLIVVVLMFLWLRLRGVALRVPRQDILLFIFTGITGYAVYNLLFTVGLNHTSAFSVAILISLGPVFTLILAAVLGMERIRPVQWLGVACSTVGVALFVGEKLGGSAPATGDALSLLAAICFAAYSLATQPLVRRHGSPMVTAWSALVGLIAIFPITLPAVVDQDWVGIGVRGWSALLYSSAISMLVAYTIWGWAIERRGVARTAPFLYLIPILTGVFSLLFLDETFGWLKVLGALLVLLGVALTRRTKRARLSAEERGVVLAGARCGNHDS
jgi:drug/metabolite transporter (DMT)-like permease